MQFKLNFLRNHISEVFIELSKSTSFSEPQKACKKLCASVLYSLLARIKRNRYFQNKKCSFYYQMSLILQHIEHN